MKDVNDLQELIQDDILARFDYLDEGEKELLCFIVRERISEYKAYENLRKISNSL